MRVIILVSLLLLSGISAASETHCYNAMGTRYCETY
jgi:hypothetical protein